MNTTTDPASMISYSSLRGQLLLLHGEHVPTIHGDSVVVPDVAVLYSVIEQLLTRVEELESRLS